MSERELKIVRTVADLRAAVALWRQDGQRIGLVPTMGALHDGHLALITRARALADRVIATIFVNPRQFGVNDDFDRYPRQEAADAAKLQAVEADLLFAPLVAEMYPPGFATTIHVAGVTDDLCGAARPGHFDGMATVVAKLLLQALPDLAVFGEKDYQQLLTIRRFARDLDIPVEIVGAPTVREADDLAMSSRNAYLSTGERRIAAALPATLRELIAAAEAGGDLRELEARGIGRITAAGFASVDYLEFRDAETLQPIDRVERPARLLAAARLGTTRLIDNMPVAIPVVSHAAG